MAISLICECGKKLAVKEELAGKRVKCPACESLITVPSVSDEPPARKRSTAPMDEDEELEGEARPRKKKKKKRAAKSSKMVWIGAGAGILVLGFCCLGGTGVGLWFLLRGGPEKPILGKWGIDVEQTKKNNPVIRDMFKALPPQAVRMAEQKLDEELGKVIIEIKADGNITVSGTMNMKSESAKWKNAQAKGDVVTIEAKADRPGEGWEKMEFRVIDGTHLQLTTTKGFNFTLWLKRL